MITSRPLRLLAAAACVSVLAGAAPVPAELLPYRARYALTLASSDGNSGVIGAYGVLYDEWDRSCDGWTEQEHFYLHLDHGEDDVAGGSVDTYSSQVTWEASDGSQFRFDLRRASSDASYEEIRGEARRAQAGAGGTIAFTRPQAAALPLPRGAVFPAAHTRLLIARAQAGDRLVGRHVFDGSDVDTAAEVSAVIGPRLAPSAEAANSKPQASLLDRPSWQMRLAFFPSDRTVEVPDYEETIRLLDNGVMQDMMLDYGDYSIHAELQQIEALPRPRC